MDLYKLQELSNLNLVEIQLEIRKIIRSREVDESVVFLILEKSDQCLGKIRFTHLTKMLEKEGFSRESISERVVNMIDNGSLKYGYGSPIGETDSEDNPIYPYIEGKQYRHICYVGK